MQQLLFLLLVMAAASASSSLVAVCMSLLLPSAFAACFAAAGGTVMLLGWAHHRGWNVFVAAVIVMTCIEPAVGLSIGKESYATLGILTGAVLFIVYTIYEEFSNTRKEE